MPKTIFFIFFYIISINFTFSQIDSLKSHFQNVNKGIFPNDYSNLDKEFSKSNSTERFIDDSQYIEYNFIEDFKGDRTGKTDNSDILQNAIDFVPDFSVIYFPPGEYLVKKPITVKDNLILRGRSPNSTFFIFDLNGENKPLFSVAGKSYEDFHFVDSIGEINQNYFYLFDKDVYYINDYIELEKENNPEQINKESTWSLWAIGGIFQIADIEEKKIFLNQGFKFDYTNQEFTKRVSKIELVQNIGFERFSLTRLDKGIGDNFFIQYAKNIYIRCVNSNSSGKNHINIQKSTNCVIFGNYIHDTNYNCGGGTGYGIWLGKHVSESLIENNILQRLRHSLILSLGANNNIIGYNYSIEPAGRNGSISNPEGCIGPNLNIFSDISIHGNYPYSNLFEHNKVSFIYLDNVWGNAGPNNTFFRNYIYSSPNKYGLSGIRNVAGTNRQFYFGNFILKSGIYDENNKAHNSNIEYGKNFGSDKINSNLKLLNDNNNLPNSLYLSETDFLDNELLPIVGPDVNQIKMLPSELRFESGKIFDKKCCGDIPGLNSQVQIIDDIFIFFENDFLYIESAISHKVDIIIHDLNGKTVFNAYNIEINQPIPINNKLVKSFYIIKIFNSEMEHTIKIKNG